MVVKVCGMCGIEKTWDKFNLRDRTSLTLSTYCKDCISHYGKIRYQENREQFIKRQARRDKQLQKLRKQKEKEAALRAKGIFVAPKENIKKEKPIKEKKASLKEYRDVVKNQPISVSDLLN